MPSELLAEEAIFKAALKIGSPSLRRDLRLEVRDFPAPPLWDY